MILQGRLNGKQRNKLKSLYDMLYTPKELADEVGINKNQVYMVYVPLGCPVQRDQSNHILINGKLFFEWYINTYPKEHLTHNQAFCKTCKSAVAILDPKLHKKNKLSYLLSDCPICGRHLTKIIKNKHDK
jgi:hypothetical protein